MSQRPPQGGKKKESMMNRSTKRLKTRFAPYTRFAVRPGAAAPCHGPPGAALEALKAQLLTEQLKATRALVPDEAIRWAADEATSLAWLTGYPLLVLPTLFEELVNAAARRARTQASIRQRSVLLQAA